MFNIPPPPPHPASPVVRELQLQSGVVRCLYGDDVCAEVRPEEKTESFDGVWFLGLASRETELSELFVRLQHDHVGSEHHASLLLFVVVDLDGCVVGYTERYHTSLVALDGGRTRSTTWRTTQRTCMEKICTG